MFTTLRWSAWGQQIWALVGAVFALTTMAILLGKFNNRPVFNQMGITLNAIVSVLSVTVKAAVAFVLSECMAQWKWILYATCREDRLMIDFDLLDGAARGPLGSLRVLTRTKGAYIAQLGAVLTLVVVALDPFAQQLLGLREDMLYDENNNGSSALISRAAFYSLGIAYSTPTSTLNISGVLLTGSWNFTTSIPLSMEGAIMSGFYKSPEDLQRETLFQCSSGSCTFEKFVTIGICHRCKDLTSDLRQMQGNYDDLLNATLLHQTSNNSDFEESGYYATGYSLPNGHFIANADGCRLYDGDGCRSNSYTTTSFGTGNPNKTVAMKDIDTLLWSMSLIYADIKDLNSRVPLVVTWPNVQLEALECGLYYCAKRVISEVRNGRLKEDIADIADVQRSADSWDLVLKDFYDNNNISLPEYRASPEELRSLEFHKLWSVFIFNPLTLLWPNSTGGLKIQEQSIKSLSAYFQTRFRWEPWFNDTRIRSELSRLPGMQNAVGFNGALLGPVESLDAVAQPATLSQLVSTSRSDFVGISGVFESIAMSMTNEIRRTREESDVPRNGMDTMTYRGRSAVMVYEVKWQWIALHVTVLILACAFMFITIIESRSNDAVPLWKGSSLAALRYGHNVGGLLNDSGESVDEMEDTARKMYMTGRRIDVEETKHSGGQYAGLVESRRASQTYLDGEGMDSSTTDITRTEGQLGYSVTTPLSEQEPKLAPRAQSHTF